MRALGVICAGWGWLCGQSLPQSDVLSPEIIQLTEIRQHMLRNLHRQPNYTCVETVERSHRASASRKFQLQDTLRLEVALVEGKEMFGWPGAKKFEDAELRDIVPSGAIGNGNFALHARAVFESNAATFQYRGETSLDGRPSVRYDFHVPLMLSGYNIRVGANESIVAYHGSFFADPKSRDVQRIEVIADDIPVVLGLAYASDRMEYARILIGDSEFLLPSASELTMIDLTGRESHNHVRFASCKQFSGESVLTFDEAPTEAPAPARVEEIEMPQDLVLVLRLIDQVDSDSSAVGDLLHAQLDRDVKFKGRVLMPKGAVAAGRITRLEKHEDYSLLGVEFLELEAAGLRAHFRAKLENVVAGPFLGLMSRPIQPGPRPGEGLIQIRSGRLRLSRGMLMFWRT